jgi:hypothetical protein
MPTMLAAAREEVLAGPIHSRSIRNAQCAVSVALQH